MTLDNNRRSQGERILMRKKWIVVFLLIIGVCGVGLCSCLAPRPEPPRRHDCAPESLLVAIDVFPDNFVSDVPLRPLPDEGGNSIGVDMGNGAIDIGHDIMPYRTPEGAKKRFDEERRGTERNHPELQRVDISGLGLHAEQAELRCGDKETSPRCIYHARYDNFYIEFILRAPEIDDPMPILTPALKDIDAKMMACFAEHPVPES